MNTHRSPRARIARPLAALATVITLLAVGAASLTSITLAAWQDKEWVNAALAVRVPRDCVTPGLYAAEGGGQMLGGSLLGLDLATIVQLRGITALNNGTTSSSVPSRAPVAPNTYANPLDATAISAVNVALSNGLQLNLPAGAAGVYNQWGQAPSTGQSAGAAGLVSNSGAIGLTGTSADATLPDSATITPSTLLPAVAGLADATIRVGAVASSSQLDWCRTLENRVTDPAAPAVVTRSYGIARVDVRSTSPVIAGVATGTAAASTAQQTTINGLAGPTGLLSTSLTAALRTVVTPALGSLSLGATATTSATVTLNLSPVSALLTETLTDGVVTINLADGTLNVRLDGLLGGTNGLNNLGPNTELVLNATVVNEIVSRVGTLLDSWSTRVVNAATTAVDNATVTATTTIPLSLSGLQVANVTATVSGTLSQVRAGTATVTASATILPGLSVLTQNIVNPILAAITGALGPAGRLTIATSVAAAVNPVVTTALTTFGTSVATATAPVVTMVSALFGGLRQVLSLAVNVQPDQPNAPPTPTARAGEYQVSALRVRLVNAGIDAAAVWLARSWAGPNTEL